jgi:hypothetical protein
MARSKMPRLKKAWERWETHLEDMELQRLDSCEVRREQAEGAHVTAQELAQQQLKKEEEATKEKGHEFARDVCVAPGDSDKRNARNLASELALQGHDACSPLRCYKFLQVCTCFQKLVP